MPLLLERYSGQDDVVIGSPIANRQEAPLESLIGFFVNMLCLRVRLTPELTFTDLLTHVRSTALEAYEYQDVPFERLVEELAPQRSLNTTPIFQVVFALQNAPENIESVPGLAIDSINGDELRVRYDLEVQVWEDADALGLTWIYNRNLFEGRRIEQMAQHYLGLVDTVLGDPYQRFGNIALLTHEEEQRLRHERNDTAAAVPSATLPGLFEAQVERTPDAVAVVCDEESLTYAALNRRANQLAHHLRTLNVTDNVPVAILLERGPQMLVSMLATLKAGGAYVPLDPAYPRERVSFMMEDSGAAVLISAQSLAEQAELIAQQSDANPTRQLALDGVSHIIYTSGSTGRPKGVVIEHRSAVNFIYWAQQTFTPDELSGVLASTSICFDLSVFEISRRSLAAAPSFSFRMLCTSARSPQPSA